VGATTVAQTPVYEEIVTGEGLARGSSEGVLRGKTGVAVDDGSDAFCEHIMSRVNGSYDRSRHIPAELAFEGWKKKVAGYYE
jgi:hypothetical protein